MRSRAVTALALVALLAGPFTSGAAAAPDSGAPPVAVDVYVQSNGDAVWNVSTTFSLNSSAERAAFDRLSGSLGSDDASRSFRVETFRELAERADRQTGRSMSITDVRHRAYVVNRTANATATPGTTTAANATDTINATGVVTLQFRWTNFADTTGDRIRVGDAFAREWALTENQVLVVHPAPNYAGIKSVDPPQDDVQNASLTWRGPITFDDGEPWVVYAPGSIEPTPSPPPDDRVDGLLDSVAAIGFAVVTGGVVAYAITRRDRIATGLRTTLADAVSDDAADTDDPDADGTPEADDSGDAVADEPETGDDLGDIDPTLLSDEERVERLLRRNGGRMKQADIVSETNWSNAKVSQLLSSMDEAGRIEKLRIGRENLITLDAEES